MKVEYSSPKLRMVIIEQEREARSTLEELVELLKNIRRAKGIRGKIPSSDLSEGYSILEERLNKILYGGVLPEEVRDALQEEYNEIMDTNTYTDTKAGLAFPR